MMFIKCSKTCLKLDKELPECKKTFDRRPWTSVTTCNESKKYF